MRIILEGSMQAMAFFGNKHLCHLEQGWLGVTRQPE